MNAIVNKNRWIRNPDFLWRDEMSWPKRPADVDRTAEERCSLEEKKAVVAGLVTPIDGMSNNLFYRFSSWFQLKKCVAWVLRYKSRLQCAANKRKRGKTMVVAPAGKIEPLDVSEIEDAYYKGHPICPFPGTINIIVQFAKGCDEIKWNFQVGPNSCGWDYSGRRSPT